MKLILLMILLFFAPAALAEEVTVQVQTSGETALVARSNGLKQAQSEALLKALSSRLPDKAADVVARVGVDKAGNLVKNFNVVKENSTARNYSAEISYEFDKDKLDKLVAEEKGLAPDVASHALLILPVWQEGNALMLWEAENPWRRVMNRVALQEGRGQLLMPTGDPQDVYIMDKEALISGDRKALVQMVARYGTKNMVIVQARNLAEKDAPPHLSVLLRHPAGTEGKPEEVTKLEYQAKNDAETEAALLERAARAVAQKLAESTGKYSLFSDEEAREVKGLVVRAEFRHSREWMEMKRAFEGLPNVDYMDIGAVSPNFAQLTFYYRGSNAMIKQALLSRGLEVNDSGKYWLVTLPN